MLKRLSPGSLTLFLLLASPLINLLPLILLLLSLSKAEPSLAYAELLKDLAQLKSELPSSGTLGYVTEPEFENHAQDKGLHNSPLPQFNSTIRFILIQYQLAPLVLKPGRNAPLIVGDFYLSGTMLKESNFKILKDFHNGFFLLKCQ